MIRPVPFYYLRHGETDWNAEGRFQGHTDVPLNARGLAQARTARDLLRGRGIVTICCSPLRRARTTAEIVNEVLGLPLVVIDDLAECGLGIREGHLKSTWYADWKAGRTPAGAEPYATFLIRALRGINRALEQDGPVLIVAHGGTYIPVRDHLGLGEIDLRNCFPMRHMPQADAASAWTVSALDASGGSSPRTG